ncbi:hypothetical protein BIW11_05620, partial [Tropilaelaps mercedesae]
SVQLTARLRRASLRTTLSLPTTSFLFPPSDIWLDKISVLSARRLCADTPQPHTTSVDCQSQSLEIASGSLLGYRRSEANHPPRGRAANPISCLTIGSVHQSAQVSLDRLQTCEPR